MTATRAAILAAVMAAAAVVAVRAAAGVSSVPYRDIGSEFSRRFSACDECFFVPRWGFVHRHGKVLLSLLVPVHPPEGWAFFSGWHFSAPGERGLLRLLVPGMTEQNCNCSSCGDGGGSALVMAAADTDTDADTDACTDTGIDTDTINISDHKELAPNTFAGTYT